MITINVDPIAFTIGVIEIRWYGIMIALTVLTLILWALREVRRDANFSYDVVFNAALIGIPFGIVFSRLLHVIDRRDYFRHNLSQIPGTNDLTIYGAVLDAALGV